MTSNDAGPEGATYTPGNRGLRTASGIALALLPVLFMVAVLLVIDEALAAAA